MATKKGSFIKKVILSVLLLILIIGAVTGYWAYKMIFQSNVFLGEKKSEFIYIHTGADFNEVLNALNKEHILINPASFERLAELKKYTNKIRPGKYRVKANVSNNELLNLLRAGMQEPVQLNLNNIRTKQQLISRVARNLEVDSLAISKYLNDDHFLSEKYGLRSETALSLFLPNTYEFYWNTSADEFLTRMAKEYKSFWTDERKAKAKQIGFKQTEVSILASIVQAEQSRFNDEKGIITGLYANRLRVGMPLQSDPTVIYAIGDFNIARVLNKDKEVDSPYNTYKHNGLPPGPIGLPETSSLDAVLNYQKNDYLYMCAKEDFSGRHNFSKTLEQHNVFANKYRQALTKLKIMH